MLDEITPLIITFNEAPNIERVLSRLSWAKRIVVVDSGSTDATLSLLRAVKRVDVFHRDFDSFAEQCNFGLTKIATPWVLSIDADYELSEALADEIIALPASNEVSGYRAKFVYRVHGRSLRGGIYPPRTILFRTARGRYVNDGHGHVLELDGAVRGLAAPVFHDDRKPLSRWFESQKRYAAIEAEHLVRTETAKLSRTDRVRRMGWPAPLLVFFYVLLVRACILDGRAGWFYAFQRMVAETMIALEVLDRRLKGEGRHAARANVDTETAIVTSDE